MSKKPTKSTSKVNVDPKTVEYYMSLPYPILLTPAPKNEEPGWYATIPLLLGLMVDGETQAQALTTLETIKREWIEWHLEDNIPLAEPEMDTAYN